MSDELVVLTDGYRCYIRVRRGIYHQVGSRGQKLGITCSGFQPRPRWKPAQRCAYDIATDGLWCPNCGRYDMRYAETGERSYCANQGKGWDYYSPTAVMVGPGFSTAWNQEQR